MQNSCKLNENQYAFYKKYNDLENLLKYEYKIFNSQIDMQDLYSYNILYNDKLYCFKKIEKEEEEAIFYMSVYKYIKNNGFDNIIAIKSTNSNEYYTKFNNEIYILYELFNEKQCRFSSREDIKKIAILLANFHASANSFNPQNGCIIKANWGKCIDNYNMAYKRLNEIKESVNKNINNEFDKTFLSSVDTYIKRIIYAKKILKESKYIDTVAKDMKNKQICLGSVRQSSFIKSNDKILIKSISKFKYNIRESDIGDFLNKIISHNKKVTIEVIEDILKLYIDSINNYNGTEKDTINKNIIGAFLIFPYDYLKFSFEYYKNNCNNYDEGNIEKFKEIELIESKKTKAAELILKNSFI